LIIPGFECLTVDIFPRSRTQTRDCLRIIVVYRAPNSPSPSLTPFIDYLYEVTSCSHPSIIVGDFNYANIDWYTYHCPTLSVTPFLDLITQGSFNQYVNFPTRGNNILDLLLCNSPIIKNVKPDIPLSDHTGIAFTINSLIEKDRVSPPSRDYSNADWASINNQIALHNWTLSLMGKTISEAYSFFSNFVNELISIYVPLKKTKHNNGLPKYLSILYERLQRYHSAAPNSDLAHSLRIRFDKALKTFEINRELRAVQSGNTNTFFKYCKARFKSNNASLPGIIDNTGKTLLSDKDKAHAFSRFFSKVQTNPLSAPLSPPLLCDSRFDLPSILPEQILLAISQLIPKCAVLHLGRLKNRSKYMLNDLAIASSNNVRDLGVHFSNGLNFGYHITQITRKTRSMCNLMLRSFHTNSSNTLIGLVNRLENVQREFTRRVLKRSQHPPLSYPNRLKLFEIETLEYRRALRDLQFLHDSIHRHALVDATNLYTLAPL
ncbi:hypothetical protein PFISCL1PPCAC_8496, partial [Pristionchus fissidentatus]